MLYLAHAPELILVGIIGISSRANIIKFPLNEFIGLFLHIFFQFKELVKDRLVRLVLIKSALKLKKSYIIQSAITQPATMSPSKGLKKQ